MNPLAKFGFFDLDAIFSTAFVFVLAATIYPDNESYLREINSTVQLFDYLSESGNQASHNRRADILQMCDHLGLFRELVDSPSQAGQTLACPHGQNAQINRQGLVQSLIAGETPVDFSEPALQWVTDIDQLLLQQDPHNFYSLYSNNGLPLAGTVETDWETLESQIFR